MQSYTLHLRIYEINTFAHVLYTYVEDAMLAFANIAILMGFIHTKSYRDEM